MMKRNKYLTIGYTVFYWGILILIGCSKGAPAGGGNTSCNVLPFSGAANSGYSATGALTVSPVSTSSLSSIIPLGNLNAPGHVYPTDHMYLVLQNSAAGANNVLAAAAGTVVSAYQPGGVDWKVIVKVDSSFYYYYDHINLKDGITTGSQISAGQTVGTNSGTAAAVDFGIYNYNLTPLAGILDTCLAASEAYVDSPLKYYPSGTVRTALYALSSSQDGKIDYDQAGKLVGDWVLDGYKAMDSTDYQLAFVYHVASSSLRISLGGTLTGGGAVYGVQNGATDFNMITPDSGQVNYQLYASTNGDTTLSGTQYGILSVQMLSSTQIKVEIFPGAGTTGTFDSNAKIYNR